MPVAVNYLASGYDEGFVARMGVNTDIISCVNGMTTVLPFGRALIYAAGSSYTHEKSLMMLPTTAGQKIRGISVLTNSITPQLDVNGAIGYPPPLTPGSLMMPAVMGMIVHGYIAVKVIEAVIIGDAPTAVITAGSTQGQFGKTPGVAQISCPVTWEFATSAAANGIALIYLK